MNEKKCPLLPLCQEADMHVNQTAVPFYRYVILLKTAMTNIVLIRDTHLGCFTKRLICNYGH